MSTMNGEPVRINELATTEINGYDNPNFENDDNLSIDRRKKNKKHAETDIKESKKTMVGFFEMFSFADGFDIFLMVVGFIAALANGLGLPIIIIIFGEMTDSFVKSGVFNASQGATTNSSECLGTPGIDLEAEMTKFALYYSGVGLAAFILSFIQVWTFFLTATRQTARIRKKFFYAILHQEISWFDTTQIGILNTRLTDDINTIREGLGDKICMFAQYFSTFVAGMVIGFVYGWKLTLVILSICPLLAASAAVWSKLLATLTAKELSSYAKAGAVAEEILSAIRTVVAFNGQQKAVSRYEVNLLDAKNAGMKKCLTINIAMGISQCLTFSAYGLGLWYGTKLTVNESANYTIGRVLIIFFSVMMGSFTLGQTAPNLESVASSRVAAYEVFKAIKKERRIDSSSTSGNKPDRLTGRIEFRNIHFSYPTRPDVQILKGLNLKIETGKTIALVGSSGCGKSTTIQLLQRFYDPLQGEVIMDGQDIRSVNVKWLREHIGVVSQEPTLFGTTIAENIRYGREEVTEAEIEQAAKEANAYDFISKLPEKFNTMVGERGAQLSGGQKQRIAIARALARNPKILLLDEATSALDTESESIVQAALDQARAGRTTILIAHHLSTVRTADVIAGLENGVVVEQGSHSELMDQKGLYYSLVMQQSLHHSSGEEEVITEDETDNEFDHFNETTRQPDNHATPSEDAPRRKSVASTRSRSSRKKSTKKRKSKKKAKKAKEEPEDLPEVPFTKVLGWNKPEWFFLILAVIAAAIAGGIYPTFAVMFGKIIGAFQEPDGEKRSQKTALMALMFFILGLISLVVYIVMVMTSGLILIRLLMVAPLLHCHSSVHWSQWKTAQIYTNGYTLGKAGENLTMRLRSLSFKALLRQEIGWFDDHKNAVGVWITRLATDASQAKGATGARMCVLTLSLCTLVTAFIIAFVHGWQLTLLILACVPFLIGAYVIKAQSMAGHAAKDQAALEEAGRISTEAVENIRTVVSLTREDAFYERYAASLNTPYKDALKTGPVYGLVYGMSQCIQYFVNAAVFRFGAWLIVHCYTGFENMFIVFSAIVFAAMSVGQSGSTAPDFGKAKVAVQRIAKLLDRQPQIDSYSKDGKILDRFDGEIEFRDTKFVYPTRPNVQVLQGLNLRIGKGKTLALVGSSGCGKSTTIQLLERFYDPVEGCVLADGTDTKSLNLKWFRSQLGIVSQEPILFDCSIAENIQYGDNNRTVTQEEIQDAAKAANIHNFIDNLPEKYNTRVGDKGAQLSGGQKQRIAIARALVRKPKVLLLDEATSALDTESEKVVQKALDDARVGRTCIVIAHRLSTVKNADVIAVIQHGKVVEQGTHSDLLAKQGVYYTLVNTQVSH